MMDPNGFVQMRKFFQIHVPIALTWWMKDIPGGTTQPNSRRSLWIFFMNAPGHY